MVNFDDYMLVINLILLLIFSLSPLITYLTVIKSIEKRYKCKLNVEDRRRRYLALYSYFKYSYPAAAIAMGYLFNSKKMIQAHYGLNEINYNVKKAPKLEIFISCLVWINCGLILVSMILYFISKNF